MRGEREVRAIYDITDEGGGAKAEDLTVLGYVSSPLGELEK
jgi:hypothetical protein